MALNCLLENGKSKENGKNESCKMKTIGLLKQSNEPVSLGLILSAATEQLCCETFKSGNRSTVNALNKL